MIWVEGDVYEGEWKSGKPNGQGRYTSVCGHMREGVWKNRKQEGWGRSVLTNGIVCEGEYKNNVLEGQGYRSHSNGELYQGEFKNGKAEGRGSYVWTNGQREDNSTGRQAYAVGAMYNGLFKNDKLHGKGILKENGSVFKVVYNENKEISRTTAHMNRLRDMLKVGIKRLLQQSPRETLADKYQKYFCNQIDTHKDPSLGM